MISEQVISISDRYIPITSSASGFVTMVQAGRPAPAVSDGTQAHSASRPRAAYSPMMLVTDILDRCVRCT
ncbi:MAG: hypothetical protein RR843_11850, partial [Clostridia bacterium]